MTFTKVGRAVVNFSLLAAAGYLDPLAIECSLYWCTNTYTATVDNANFTEIP